MLADQFVKGGGVEGFPLEQFLRDEIELIAMLRQDRAGILVGVVEDFLHLHIDLADRLLAAISLRRAPGTAGR